MQSETWMLFGLLSVAIASLVVGIVLDVLQKKRLKAELHQLRKDLRAETLALWRLRIEAKQIRKGVAKRLRCNSSFDGPAV